MNSRDDRLRTLVHWVKTAIRFSNRKHTQCNVTSSFEEVWTYGKRNDVTCISSSPSHVPCAHLLLPIAELIQTNCANRFTLNLKISMIDQTTA
jgi:hypothetical protein